LERGNSREDEQARSGHKARERSANQYQVGYRANIYSILVLQSSSAAPKSTRAPSTTSVLSFTGSFPALFFPHMAEQTPRFLLCGPLFSTTFFRPADGGKKGVASKHLSKQLYIGTERTSIRDNCYGIREGPLHASLTSQPQLIKIIEAPGS
jgi:hypothetical protein